MLMLQEVPHDLRDDVRLAAGGGVRGQLQEELLHRVRDHCLQPDSQGRNTVYYFLTVFEPMRAVSRGNVSESADGL